MDPIPSHKIDYQLSKMFLALVKLLYINYKEIIFARDVDLRIAFLTGTLFTEHQL